jgi:sugar/nucleoside kinase (ribokinase family)
LAEQGEDELMTCGIFVGLSTIDVVYGVDEFPQENSKVAARTQDVFVGGPATNASIAFSHLGGTATLVTAVGCHALAGVVREELQKYSVQLIDLNPGFGEVPVLSSISVDRRGRRNIVSANETRVAALLAEADLKALKGARVVLVDGHYMQACQAWARAARAQGTPVVLDAGSWKEGTGELLKSVDTAICSADFLPPGCATEDAVLNYIKDCGVTSIAITRGAEPVRYVTGGTSGTVEVPQVEVVDTMGAGDIFHGAFCYFMSIGRGFVEALREAAKVAAESCRFRGTRGWMKDQV